MASIKHKFSEPIDDYLNRFCLLKAMCFTQVPEHEFVEMAAGGFDYSIRKKLDTQYLRYISQLVDRVRQVEHLKAEKARATNNNRRERVAYVDIDEDDQETSSYPLGFDEREIDLAELKQGSPYSYKVLAPSNGKNVVELEKNDKLPKKTYTFDVTKCDKFFELLVKDGQMIVPLGAKIPLLERQKKRGLCKYHNILGHQPLQCFLFRDLVQNAVKDGRLRFGDKKKSQMKIDSDPLQVPYTHYTEPTIINMVEAFEGCNKNTKMVETTEGFKKKSDETEATEGLRVKLEKLKTTDGTNLEINMVEVSSEKEANKENSRQCKEQVRVFYPKSDEILVKLLHRCQKKNSKVMVCPRCSSVFDKKAAENVESLNSQSQKELERHSQSLNFR